MPSPFRDRTCKVCYRTWSTRSPNARTCSPLCRASLREIEHPTKGAPIREYPQEVIDLICGMYRNGMTAKEIIAVAPKGFRVQTILERYLPMRRAQIKREQRGEKNATWKGIHISYSGVHVRLGSLFGPAKNHSCADCVQPAADWSYVHDCPEEKREAGRPAYCVHPDHYQPRCKSCHRAYDRKEVSHV